jgi:hypothetical protein
MELLRNAAYAARPAAKDALAQLGAGAERRFGLVGCSLCSWWIIPACS